MEASLALPIFLYLILALIDLARYTYTQLGLTAAAQAGADQASKFAIEENLSGVPASETAGYRARVVGILNTAVEAASPVAAPIADESSLVMFQTYRRDWYDVPPVNFAGFENAPQGITAFAAFLRPGEKAVRQSDQTEILHPTLPTVSWPSGADSWPQRLNDHPVVVILEARLSLLTLFGSTVSVRGQALSFRQARQPGRPVNPLPEPTATTPPTATNTPPPSPTITQTPTPPNTPTQTATRTITSTPTQTHTPTITSTPTSTPDCNAVPAGFTAYPACSAVVAFCNCGSANSSGCYANCVQDRLTKDPDELAACIHCNNALGCSYPCPTATSTPTPTITPTGTNTLTPTATPTQTSTPDCGALASVPASAESWNGPCVAAQGASPFCPCAGTNCRAACEVAISGQGYDPGQTCQLCNAAMPGCAAVCPTSTPTPIPPTPLPTNTPQPPPTEPPPPSTPTNTPVPTPMNTPNCSLCACPEQPHLRPSSSCCFQAGPHYAQCQGCSVCNGCCEDEGSGGD